MGITISGKTSYILFILKQACGAGKFDQATKWSPLTAKHLNLSQFRCIMKHFIFSKVFMTDMPLLIHEGSSKSDPFDTFLIVVPYSMCCYTDMK